MLKNKAKTRWKKIPYKFFEKKLKKVLTKKRKQSIIQIVPHRGT